MFSWWSIAERWAAERGRDKFDFFRTKKFRRYMDGYAAFIKKHINAIDYYANCDVIPNPELTWEHQLYLEKKHGLSPIPVVHYRTDLRWLRRYIDRGRHDLIALGGLVGSTAQEECRNWLDRAFDVICDRPSRLPRVRVHGFGVTSHPLLFRYPWWSVDSTTWTMVGGNGEIMVPQEGRDGWNFREPPHIINVSRTSKDFNVKGKHFNTMGPAARAVVLKWLAELGIPVGENGPSGEITSYGVSNRHCERKAANLHYYERLRAEVPNYPWPFKGPKRAQIKLELK